jgi:uncharacterized protein (DUF1697 family)
VRVRTMVATIAGMQTYLVLMRGINVGGKNKVPMPVLKARLEERRFANVMTYIQSGNVLLQSELDPQAVRKGVEKCLRDVFAFDPSIVKVLVLTSAELQAVVSSRPPGFGDQPEKHRSDVIFLIDIDPAEALSAFTPRPGVDELWPGIGVIYSQRRSAELSKSRLTKILTEPAYKSMTIRSWNTTTTLLNLSHNVAAGERPDNGKQS